MLVICIGWRCTPAGHEPCHLLFNFEHLFDVSRSQRRGQRDRRRDRTLDQNQWFGGTLSFARRSFHLSVPFSVLPCDALLSVNCAVTRCLSIHHVSVTCRYSVETAKHIIELVPVGGLWVCPSCSCRMDRFTATIL